eukprot:TRINITY_DN2654_c0_g1_i3.p1 TRINITY_DN2654_c0_g1~~TRINITY_DN2654_c0_g1_i3.p1  ORF type:complete len:201 (-),score=22.83 TRINITY_DN2654_c0_g1_i3:205-747(-)
MCIRDRYQRRVHGDNLKKMSEQKRLKRTHQKIDHETRQSLLHKIFYEHKKIKTAAYELRINYSSAKTILFHYRKNKRKDAKVSESATQVCGVTSVNSARQLIAYELEITHGGKNPRKMVHTVGEEPEEKETHEITDCIDRISDITAKIIQMNQLMMLVKRHLGPDIGHSGVRVHPIADIQ